MQQKYTLLFIAFLSLYCQNSFSQAFEIKSRAKILEFNPPYEILKVDILDDQEDFIKEIALNANIKITNKKGKLTSTKDLAPGNEVNLIGEKINYKDEIYEIRILTQWKGKKEELEGIIEFYDPQTGIAVVDGHRIKLAQGTKIKGKSKYKGKDFRDLSRITQGNFMKMKGIRQQDGFILVDKASLEENEFTNADRGLQNALSSEFSSESILPVSIPKELEEYTDHIGQGHAQFGDAQFKLIEDLEVQAYVSHVGNKVVPAWQKNIPDGIPEKFDFRFYVIDNPTFNAFALPNGIIFVHSGLLKMLNNEAQLAAVLSHEIAHVTHEHAKERYEKRKKINLGKKVLKIALKSFDAADIELAELLSGNLYEEGKENAVRLVKEVKELPPQTKSALRGVALGLKGIASNGHNKSKETQADRVSLFYMYQAGYDPREAATIWKKFMDHTKREDIMSRLENVAEEWLTMTEMYPYDNPLVTLGDLLTSRIINSALDNWFSSHPKAKERFRNLNQLIAVNYARDDLSQTTIGEEAYQKIKILLPE